MLTLDVAPPAFSPSAGLRLHDDILAPATPPGPAARAILRLSGPNAWSLVAGLLSTPTELRPGRHPVQIRLPDFFSPLPVHLQVWKGPRTYTGQDLVEIHTISSPPLVQAFLDTLLERGARLAQPGEFTLRAFLTGKLDLTQAEAVLALTNTQDTDELRTALAQLAGGLARPLDQLREDLLHLLAEVEAGLDFADEDLSFIDNDVLARRIELTMATLIGMRDRLDNRGRSQTTFRVVLAGPPNAGKSSLFNALAGEAKALVSPQPGTTRDYLSGVLNVKGVSIELVDTAGREASPQDQISRESQAARGEQLRQAHLVLMCFDVTKELSEEDLALLQTLPSGKAVLVATKCDLSHHTIPEDAVRTSALTGAGLSTLRFTLTERARASYRPAAVAPSLTRCRGLIDRAVEALQRAAELTYEGQRMELVAAELRLALDEIGAMVGAVYTNDLLDRIFSQFCIGK